MTKSELLQNAKPILFNTEMLQAILDGRKTVTRRVIKPQTVTQNKPDGQTTISLTKFMETNKADAEAICLCCAPFQPNDILYVRETWQKWDENLKDDYIYKACHEDIAETYKSIGIKWRSPRFVPKEAARLFLKVTDVKVERVQDITEEQAEKEGAYKAVWNVSTAKQRDKIQQPTFVNGFANLWNDMYAKPKPAKHNGIITHYASYPWENIKETREYKDKKWYVMGNPFVWVYEFERVGAE
ncbi:MAG: hypothetical protein M0R40_00555 [Firmicutes bacterium]|nr:hypothetical protein [Bacillota bacterium]